MRDEKVNGSTACVAMDVVFIDGMFVPAVFQFSKEEEHWKILTNDLTTPYSLFQVDPADTKKPISECK